MKTVLLVVVLVLAPLACFPLAVGLIPGLWRRRGEAPPPAAADLERRRPVWDALSELYLDTQLDDADHARIAAVLVDSGYGVEQLEEILYRELHPVLVANLLSVAGEWAGFDLEWLEAQILRRRPRPARFALVFGQGLVRDDWTALQTQLRRAGR